MKYSFLFQTSAISPLYLIIPLSIVFCGMVLFIGLFWKYFHKEVNQPSFLQFQFLRWKRTNNGQCVFIKQLRKQSKIIFFKQFFPNNTQLDIFQNITQIRLLKETLKTITRYQLQFFHLTVRWKFLQLWKIIRLISLWSV